MRSRPLPPRTLDAAIAGGLALAVIGVYGRSAWPGSALAGGLGAVAIGLGALLVAGALIAVGRGVHATRYRPERWSRRDTLVAAASLCSLAAFVAVWIWRRGELAFYPYPRLTLPDVSPWLTSALVLLAVPAAAAWMPPDPDGCDPPDGAPGAEAGE